MAYCAMRERLLSGLAPAGAPGSCDVTKRINHRLLIGCKSRVAPASTFQLASSCKSSSVPSAARRPAATGGGGGGRQAAIL